MHVSDSYVAVRLEPIMLKNLPDIPSRTSQKVLPIILPNHQLLYSFSYQLLILLGQ